MICSRKMAIQTLETKLSLVNNTRHYESFIYPPTDAPVSCLKKAILKFYIKIYMKTAPTCFGVTVTPSSESALICAY